MTKLTSSLILPNIPFILKQGENIVTDEANQAIKLKDGRALRYTEYGDSQPEPGDKLQAPITFYWTGDTDDSWPVAYDLQIATDKEFSRDSIIIEKEDLAKTEYTIIRAADNFYQPVYCEPQSPKGEISDAQGKRIVLRYSAVYWCRCSG
ncbi:MAG: hypothetical protein H8E40_05445 [Chloroflexi bacterium]|nr:hypothetical protein [Chloroflexota bacterium]